MFIKEYTKEDLVKFIEIISDDKNLYAHRIPASGRKAYVDFYIVLEGVIVNVNRIIYGLKEAEGGDIDTLLDSLNANIRYLTTFKPELTIRTDANTPPVSDILRPIYQKLEKAGFEVCLSKGEFHSYLNRVF